MNRSLNRPTMLAICLVLITVACGFCGIGRAIGNPFITLVSQYTTTFDRDHYRIPAAQPVLGNKALQSPNNTVVEIVGYAKGKDGKIAENHTCAGSVVHIGQLIITNAHCRALIDANDQVVFDHGTLTDRIDPILKVRTHWPSGAVRQVETLGKPCALGTTFSGDRDNDYALYFLKKPLQGVAPLKVLPQDQLPSWCSNRLDTVTLMPGEDPNNPVQLYRISNCRRETRMESRYNGTYGTHMIGTDCGLNPGGSGSPIFCDYGASHFVYSLEEGGPKIAASNGTGKPIGVPLTWKNINISIPIQRMIPAINKCLRQHNLPTINSGQSDLPPPSFRA